MVKKLKRQLESSEVAMSQFLRRRQDARCDGDPEDGVGCRGLVTPALASLCAKCLKSLVGAPGLEPGTR